jgi:hypothetical protein
MARGEVCIKVLLLLLAAEDLARVLAEFCERGFSKAASKE